MGNADYAFLHGGGQGSWVWDATIAAMAAQSASGLRTIALDAPGCGGKSGRDTSALDLPAVIVELADDLDRSGLRDIVLVGHSQAGTALPMLARARPDLIRKLVYVSCVAPKPDETTLNWRESMPASGSALTETAHAPGTRERYREMFCNDMAVDEADRFLDRLGPDQWPAAVYGASGWRYDDLAALPATYVLCLRDAVLTPDWQAIFAKRLGVESVVHIDAAHQAMLTRPHALAEILLAEA